MKRKILAMVLVAFSLDVIADDLEFDPVKLKNFRAITIREVQKEPRYILVLDKHRYCWGSFTDLEKRSIEYLSVPDALNIWTDEYSGSAEAWLIKGVFFTDEKIVAEVLRDYPDFWKEIRMYEECYLLHRTDTVFAIGNFTKAKELGSELADSFLDAYRHTLGEKRFNFYLEESKK